MSRESNPTFRISAVDELRRIKGPRDPIALQGRSFDADIERLVLALKSHDPQLLRNGLRWHLKRISLHRFISGIVSGLNNAVGDLWTKGDVSVWEEHLYTEQIEFVLHEAIHRARGKNVERPKILLTTFPGELHKIGLLMVEALLTAEKVACIPLGTQSPTSEIVDCSISNRIDIVALSFSSAFPLKTALARLSELRSALPSSISIWAGGRGVKGIRKMQRNICMPMDLSSIPFALGHWNRDRGSE